MTKHVLSMLALSLIATFGLTSCLQSHTVVSVNKDGSATVEEKSILTGMMAQTLQQMAKAFQPEGEGDQDGNSNLLMDRASYEAKAKAMGEGVKLKELKELKAPNGGIGVQALFTVPDINKLKITASGGDVPEVMKQLSPDIDQQLKEEEVEPISFAYKGGQLKIKVPQPDRVEAIEKSNEELEGLEPEINLGPENAQQLEMAKMMFKDAAITLKIKANDGIAKTDASHHAGSEITLFELKFSEILKDPGAFNKLALLGDDLKDKSKAMAVMKKLPGVTVESKEEISVTLK